MRLAEQSNDRQPHLEQAIAIWAHASRSVCELASKADDEVATGLVLVDGARNIRLRERFVISRSVLTRLSFRVVDKDHVVICHSCKAAVVGGQDLRL